MLRQPRRQISKSNVLTMILAGGVGERLRPLTLRRCKPAIPFAGTLRVIDFTLMNCVASGLTEIRVLTQYRAESLERHCRQRYRRSGLQRVNTLPPKGLGPYRGTADAVYKNLDLLDEKPDAVLILSGDHVYHADYQRFVEWHLDRSADVSVLTGKVAAREASSFGVLEIDDERITRFVEKPANPFPYSRDGYCSINLGVYCFRPQFLVEQLLEDARTTSTHDFGKNILPTSLEVGIVQSCPLAEVSSGSYWRDVGTIDAFFEASMDVVHGNFEIDPGWPSELPFRQWLPRRFERNLVSDGVTVGTATVENCVISPGVRIEPGCHLQECVLFPGATVGRGARLRRVIVEEGMRVPPRTEIGFPATPKGVAVFTEDPVLSPKALSGRIMARSKQTADLPPRSNSQTSPRTTCC